MAQCRLPPHGSTHSPPWRQYEYNTGHWAYNHRKYRWATRAHFKFVPLHIIGVPRGFPCYIHIEVGAQTNQNRKWDFLQWKKKNLRGRSTASRRTQKKKLKKEKTLKRLPRIHTSGERHAHGYRFTCPSGATKSKCPISRRSFPVGRSGYSYA